MRLRDWAAFFVSRSFLMNRKTLWLLFALNLAGTAYGYVWYANQLADTHLRMADWLLPFVPDSPTASLFFTASLLWLLMAGEKPNPFRYLLGALAFITSFKYGIWAVVIIMAGAVQGNELQWQDWMLSVSHLGMALEVLLYARWLGFRFIHTVWAGAWTFLNDAVDYTYGVFPWLPEELYDDVPAVERFTVALTAASLAAAWAMLPRRTPFRR